MAGVTETITDAGMVTIPLWEYEELVRDSERLQVLKNFVSHTEYVSKKDLLVMISGVEKEGEK